MYEEPFQRFMAGLVLWEMAGAAGLGVKTSDNVHGEVSENGTERR